MGEELLFRGVTSGMDRVLAAADRCQKTEKHRLRTQIENTDWGQQTEITVFCLFVVSSGDIQSPQLAEYLRKHGDTNCRGVNSGVRKALPEPARRLESGDDERCAVPDL